MIRRTALKGSKEGSYYLRRNGSRISPISIPAWKLENSKTMSPSFTSRSASEEFYIPTTGLRDSITIIRKITKRVPAFPSPDSLLNLVFMATQHFEDGPYK